MFLPPEELGDLIQTYNNEALALREQVADICYFMNGGIEWNSAWGLSFEDREIVIKIINRRKKEENPNAKDYF